MTSSRLITASRIAGLLMMLTSIVPGYLCYLFYAKTSQLLKNGVETSGIVIALREAGSDEGSTSYHTVFEFTDASSTVRRVESTWATSPASHSVGDNVTVIYDPSIPGDAQIKGFASQWLGVVICGVMTLIPIIVGASVLLIAPIVIRRSPKAVKST